MTAEHKRGLKRLSIATLTPWFIYWSWLLFSAEQRLWAAEETRYNPLGWYDAAKAERDQILFVAIGVPLALAIIGLTTRWVLRGFKADANLSDDMPF